MKKIGIISIFMGIVFVFINTIIKIKERASISIIGGADGPTSIFVAGEVGNEFGNLGIIAGIIFLAVGIYIFLKKK